MQLKNELNKRENLKMKEEKRKNRRIVSITSIVTFIICLSMPFVCFAAGSNSNTSLIDPFIDFICDWLVKIGAVVAMVGGVMFAVGWQREDAEGKSRGLMTVMSGGIMAAIGLTPSIFGI